MKRALTTLVLAAVATAAGSQQWDGSVTGKITALDVTNAENFGFRIFIGGQQMCAGGGNFAFINKSNDNYNAYLSVLMLAKATDKTVVVFSKLVAGQCEVGYVSVQG